MAAVGGDAVCSVAKKGLPEQMEIVVEKRDEALVASTPPKNPLGAFLTAQRKLGKARRRLGARDKGIVDAQEALD